MSDVTHILRAIEEGEPRAAEQLLPLVYDELRQLAAQRLAHEMPGQTLQPTALVHEVYLRLVDGEQAQHWDSRGHFFAAAAEAMRRILVENARRKRSRKHGGGLVRRDLDDVPLIAAELGEDLLALDEALNRLAEKDPVKAELVKLRHFAGLTFEQAAQALGISTTTANRYWAYARAWLHREIVGGEAAAPGGPSEVEKNERRTGPLPGRSLFRRRDAAQAGRGAAAVP
jgi:RNA polymerase sigma factor (TIGR02999 family)